MRKITVARLSEFLRYQWVFFLALYWGLRLIQKPAFAQTISAFLTFGLLVSLTSLMIGYIAHDRGMMHCSHRVIREMSISLILILLSEVLVILWVFVEFDNIQVEYVIQYLLYKYGLWILFPIICLVGTIQKRIITS